MEVVYMDVEIERNESAVLQFVDHSSAGGKHIVYPYPESFASRRLVRFLRHKQPSNDGCPDHDSDEGHSKLTHYHENPKHENRPFHNLRPERQLPCTRTAQSVSGMTDNVRAVPLDGSQNAGNASSKKKHTAF